MDWFFGSWEWYIAGPLIGLFVPLLLVIGNKQLGVSASFENICSVIMPGSKNLYQDYLLTFNAWKVFFVFGIAFGAYLAVTFLSSADLQFLPEEYYSISGSIKLFIGGLLVGFGTRYANGCTSGHAIFGLSVLSSASLKATLSFFAGGLIYTFISNLL